MLHQAAQTSAKGRVKHYVDAGSDESSKGNKCKSDVLVQY